MAASHRQNLPQKLPSRSSEIVVPNGKPIKECLDSQDQLLDLLQQTYTMLKKYDEAADSTQMREAGFQWVLEDYTIEQVTAAFKTYLKTGKEIPTPADIVEILGPSVKRYARECIWHLSVAQRKGRLNSPERNFGMLTSMRIRS